MRIGMWMDIFFFSFYVDQQIDTTAFYEAFAADSGRTACVRLANIHAKFA